MRCIWTLAVSQIGPSAYTEMGADGACGSEWREAQQPVAARLSSDFLLSSLRRELQSERVHHLQHGVQPRIAIL